MKTRLEKNSLILNCLSVVSNGYTTGDFSQLFSLLSKDCVFESQWVMTPNIGYDNVVSYLTAKGNTLKRTDSFPICTVQELVGDINMTDNSDIIINGEKTHASFGLLYEPGELCLLIKQTIDDKTNDMILRLQLNDEERISRIDLCMPELFRYKEFSPCIRFIPVRDGKKIDDAAIYINAESDFEIELFLCVAGINCDKYIQTNIPMSKWVKFTDSRNYFYFTRSFDEAFEKLCGIDYSDLSAENEKARYRFCDFGKQMWNERGERRYIVDAMNEWTDKYKDSCDSVVAQYIRW